MSILDGHQRSLETTDNLFDGLEITGLDCSSNLRQVGPGRKHLALIGDYQTDTFVLCPLDRFGGHAQNAIIDGIHL